MNLRRGFIIGAVIIGLAALIGLGLREPPTRVEVAPVVRERLAVSVEEEGMTRVRERYEITAPIGGKLQRIAFDVGDAVTKGDVIATLLPSPSAPLDERSYAEARVAYESARAAWQRAGHQVRSAQADYDYAEHELGRARELADQNETILTRSDLERAERDEAVARHTLEAAKSAERVAEHEMKLAETRYQVLRSSEARDQQVQLRAPTNGRVLALLQESEAVVAIGTPILHIGNPAELEVAVDVLSSDAVKIKPGDPAEIQRWGGDTTLRARVRRVEPSGFTKVSALGVEEQRVWVILDPEGEGWDALGDQYRVEVAVIIWERPDALVAPASSVFRNEKGWAVYTLDGSTAELRSVTVGQRTSTYVQILNGLSEREEVILHPSKHLRDGATIERNGQ